MKTNLYKVTVVGFLGKPIKHSMVLATDPTTAYDKVRAFLDAKNYGFAEDRELQSIELIASESWYTATPHQLFL